ncbi:MAG: heavy metal-binding domain-containing protein [Lachnospiraceae bacterium]|nr:heavy metal-binding domain-containing protein [Lachnospiraceae bacterium]
MIVCCICGKKLGRNVEGHAFSAKYNQLRLCNTCHTNQENLRVNTEGNIEVIQKSKEYFEDYLYMKLVAASAREPLQQLLQGTEEAIRESLRYRYKNKSIPATTGNGFEGYRMTDYKGVISGEVVLNVNALTELAGQISDISGKTNSIVEQKISDAKEEALENLKQKAVLEGGNAVLGVSFCITNLLDNMLLVSANGTAVVVEK